MLRHECMQCVNVDSASILPVVHSLTTGPTETIRLYAIETYPCILGGLCLSEHSSSLSYRELVSLAVCRIAMATTRCQKVYALPQAVCYSRSGNPQTRSWRCDSFILNSPRSNTPPVLDCCFWSLLDRCISPCTFFERGEVCTVFHPLACHCMFLSFTFHRRSFPETPDCPTVYPMSRVESLCCLVPDVN